MLRTKRSRMKKGPDIPTNCGGENYAFGRARRWSTALARPGEKKFWKREFWRRSRASANVELQEAAIEDAQENERIADYIEAMGELMRERITLGEEDWKRFVSELENPSPPSPALVGLMARKPLWEK